MVAIATTSPVYLSLSLSLFLPLPSCFIAALSLWRETNDWKRRRLFYILVQWYRKASSPNSHPCVVTCSDSAWCYFSPAGCICDSCWLSQTVLADAMFFFSAQCVWVGVTDSSRKRHQQESLVILRNAAFYLWPCFTHRHTGIERTC